LDNGRKLDPALKCESIVDKGYTCHLWAREGLILKGSYVREE